jgi:hypothetical protein
VQANVVHLGNAAVDALHKLARLAVERRHLLLAVRGEVLLVELQRVDLPRAAHRCLVDQRVGGMQLHHVVGDRALHGHCGGRWYAQGKW